MTTKKYDINISGIVKSKGYYNNNRIGHWNCNLCHFDINNEDLANIIENYYEIELDKRY